MSKSQFDTEILKQLSDIAPFTFNDVKTKIPNLKNSRSLVLKYTNNGILKQEKISSRNGQVMINRYTISQEYQHKLKKNFRMRII